MESQNRLRSKGTWQLKEEALSDHCLKREADCHRVVLISVSTLPIIIYRKGGRGIETDRNRER